MDGPMSGVDPDQVENDAGSMWRALYKLEKQFSETPNPLQMAKKVLYCIIKCVCVCCVHLYFTPILRHAAFGYACTDQGAC